MGKYNRFVNNQVEAKFVTYPKTIRPKLLFLRELIFDTAAGIQGVGEIEETLKWGEPSYVTSQSKSGSTIRIDWKQSSPDHYYLFFNCKTTLVDDFKEIYGDLFNYGGNRSVIFKKDDKIPVNQLSDCIAMALTYHLKKKRK